MQRLSILATALGLAIAPLAVADAKPAADDHTALVKLVASDGLPSDRLGISVAISGDTALVGAPVDDGERGAAYVFRRVDGAWTQEAKLVALDGRPPRKFGYSVALSGDTAVIGGTTGVIAGAEVHVDPTPGSAYVFERAGKTWSQKAKLTAPVGSATDDFGNAVAVSGDTVAVSAGGVGAGGVVYVYGRARGAWKQQAELSASDAAAGDRFGVSSVSISDDTLVVGVPFDDVGADKDQGSAYVFTREGERWNERQQLTDPEGAAGDNFGFSVRASGDTLVVGAHLDDVGSEKDQGSAYVFVQEGAIWTMQAHLVAENASGADEFGRSVAVSGDTLIVGAMKDASGEVPAQQEGSAYVFTRDGTTWSQLPKLVAAEGGFGVSVALSRRTAVIGAGFEDLHQGAAYIWDGSTRCGTGCGARSARDPSIGSSPAQTPSSTVDLPKVE